MQRKNAINRMANINSKRRMEFYPVAYCTGEDKVIGFGIRPLKVKADKFGGIKIKKVHAEQWRVAKWLSPEHKIDFTKCVKGSMVLCPKCLGKIDFRAFMSSTVPEFKNVDKQFTKTGGSQANQLPET